jgi:hypothetical protein
MLPLDQGMMGGPGMGMPPGMGGMGGMPPGMGGPGMGGPGMGGMGARPPPPPPKPFPGGLRKARTVCWAAAALTYVCERYLTAADFLVPQFFLCVFGR